MSGDVLTMLTADGRHVAYAGPTRHLRMLALLLDRAARERADGDKAAGARVVGLYAAAVLALAEVEVEHFAPARDLVLDVWADMIAALLEDGAPGEFVESLEKWLGEPDPVASDGLVARILGRPERRTGGLVDEEAGS